MNKQYEERFKQLLNVIPFYKRYYDEKEKEFDIDGIERVFGTIVLSSSEKYWADFLILVWTGESYGLKDYKGKAYRAFEGMGRLDLKYREIIANWVMNPFTM